jgi:hypothetical protein
MGRTVSADLPDGLSEIFLREGLDTPVDKPPDGANHLTAMRADSAGVPNAVLRAQRLAHMHRRAACDFLLAIHAVSQPEVELQVFGE